MLLRTTIAVEPYKLSTRIKRLLKQENVLIDIMKSGDLNLSRLANESTDILIISRVTITEPAPTFIRDIINLPEAPAIVVISDMENPNDRAALLAAGCEAVLFADLPDNTLKDVLHTIIQRHITQAKKNLVDGGGGLTTGARLSDFVSNSSAMHALMNTVKRIVQSKSSILILGETGVGKEYLARSIHTESPRSQGAFIAINCGALPENLLESELFGHEQGAFTGATRSHRGAFEQAHGGTIFLDEIGEMPFHLQVKLLRVLQDHRIRRVGGEKSIALNVRVVAASNKDLQEETKAKRFRHDLFYRLSVVSLVVPPLRERKEDIPSLVESYIKHFRYTINRSITGITNEAMRALVNYSWPGNVREVMNVIERAVLLCDQQEITLEHLPLTISRLHETAPDAQNMNFLSLHPQNLPQNLMERPLNEVKDFIISEIEKKYLEHVLTSTGGRIGEAAKRAGITTRALYNKMKINGLKKEQFRRIQT